MPFLHALFEGPTSPVARIWTAIGPALFLMAYFLIGMAVYAIRYQFKGHLRDENVEKRGDTVLVNMWLRLYFSWLMQPLWRVIVFLDMPASAITTLSVLLGLGSGVSLAAGRFALGGWLYILSGICDFIDGRVARMRGTSSQSGAALDSILDRYSDAAILGGLCFFYRDTWVLFPCLMALIGASLVPYVRAKAESLGMSMSNGIMQRTERIVYLGVSTAVSPLFEAWYDPTNPRPLHHLAVAGIVFLAISTHLTALHRFFNLLRNLNSALGESKKSVSEMSTPKQLVRNLVSASVATGVDFGVVNVLVEMLGMLAPYATACGCAVGAVVNFLMNRQWTFGSRDKAWPQFARYAFVSTSSAFFNAGGVAIMLLLDGVNYRVAWVIVRVLVFFAWNFILQKEYVFATRA